MAAKTTRRAIIPLTTREVDALLAQCSKRAPSGVRDAALIGVLVGAGLRVAEAVSLSRSDYDAERSTLLVRSGKGGKTRTVRLMRSYGALLDRWLSRRETSRSQPLFCQITRGRSGLSLSTEAVRKMVKRRAARAGISSEDREVWPHLLRHTHASVLAHERVPLTSVQAQLGHSRATITDAYLHSIGVGRHLEDIASIDG